MSNSRPFTSDALRTHRIVFHYTPKHSSWLNQIEIWFSILVRKLLKRASFKSQDDLKTRILDGDSLPRYGESALREGFPPQATDEPRSGEKPFGWKASGKRVKRGLYQSADGLVVNADLNGAANIFRKVAGRLGILLDQLSRRSMAVVTRVRLT